MRSFHSFRHHRFSRAWDGQEKSERDFQLILIMKNTDRILELKKFIEWLSARIEMPRMSDDIDKLVALRRSIIAELTTLKP